MKACFPRLLRPLLLGAAFALAGCSDELQHNLPEQDANDILVLLSENGIGASKVLEAGGNEPTFTVKVGKSDYRQAAKLLTQYSLPHPKTPGLEMFRMGKGMIPTQTEERAMLMEALGGEVSRALQKVDNVLEARTIVDMPENNDLTQPDKRPPMTASVFVKYRRNLESKAPFEEEKLKRFVASALPEMKPENVVVLMTEALPVTAEVSSESRMQSVLGFNMSAASAQEFRVAVGVAALAMLVLAALAAWGFMRGTSPAPKARVRPRTEA